MELHEELSEDTKKNQNEQEKSIANNMTPRVHGKSNLNRC